MHERIGIFGGAFDPPHAAHVMVAGYALCCAGIDRLLVIPCAQHPFDKQMSPFDIRLKMAKSAFSIYKDLVEVNPIEGKLPPPSYTVRTLEALKGRYPEADFVLIMGSDNARRLDKWKEPERIRELARIFVVQRASNGIVSFPPISSTLIRNMIRRGDDVSTLIPEGVLRIIQEKGLYRGKT